MNNKTRIFEFLYRKGNESYNINQISRLIGISVGSAFKILKEFEKIGYVIANKRSNALLYQIKLNDKTNDIYERLDEEKNEKSKKKTKIVCTIGPASDKPAIIKKLIEKGMNAARIDVSNCNEKEIVKRIENVREASIEIPILIDIPNSKLHKPWIKFALKNDLDFISILAVNAEDVKRINRHLGYDNIKQVIGEKIKVIAKLGKTSLKNYKEVVEEAYGVITDRSELAANMKLENLPQLQRRIIEECNRQDKPAIVAGNMLDSMIKNNKPEQSEVYDISNVVIEGASCIMLSEETGSGKYPLEAVEMTSKIVKNEETGYISANENDDYDFTHFVGKSVSELERALRIDALLIITSGGYSARMISSRRLKCKTIAATSSRKIFRQLNLLWGIEPLYVNINSEDISNNEKRKVILNAVKKGFIGKSDQIAIIASVFNNKSKRTNILEIHNVEEFLNYVDKNKNKELGKIQVVK